MATIQTHDLGRIIGDLLADHMAACEENDLPSIPIQGLDTEDLAIECVSEPEGDASNLLVELSNGQRFRVQIYAR